MHSFVRRRLLHCCQRAKGLLLLARFRLALAKPRIHALEHGNEHGRAVNLVHGGDDLGAGRVEHAAEAVALQRGHGLHGGDEALLVALLRDVVYLAGKAARVQNVVVDALGDTAAGRSEKGDGRQSAARTGRIGLAGSKRARARAELTWSMPFCSQSGRDSMRSPIICA